MQSELPLQLVAFTHHQPIVAPQTIPCDKRRSAEPVGTQAVTESLRRDYPNPPQTHATAATSRISAAVCTVAPKFARAQLSIIIHRTITGTLPREAGCTLGSLGPTRNKQKHKEELKQEHKEGRKDQAGNPQRIAGWSRFAAIRQASVLNLRQEFILGCARYVELSDATARRY